MSTLTISYDKMNEEDKGKVESAVAFFEGLGKDQKTIFATLKSAFSSLKDLFTFTSDKPKSATEVFNDFIAQAQWQDSFTEANKAMILANAERELLLKDANSLPAASFKPRYTTGQDPQRKAWVIEIVVDKDGDHKELFNLIDSRHETHIQATEDLKAVSLKAVHALYPDGNDNITKDGATVKQWKAIKTEQGEDGKWEAAGRASAPVDPNKPRPIGVARVGKTTVTVTYGEELVYSGSNKNLAYTKGGIFASDHKLPGWTDERYQGFGRRNGQEVLVATDWIHTGMDRLQKAGLTVKEELTTKA